MAASACGSTGPEIPPVEAVRVTPTRAAMDIGDTLRLSVTLEGSDREPVEDPGLEWSTSGASATVDSTGLVTALARGTVWVQAEASNGTVGEARVTVSPVSGIQPDTGRYGALVIVTGPDLPAGLGVQFTKGDGWVDAAVRSAGSDAVEVWVPVGTDTGPLRLTWGDGEAVTQATFDLTAETDVLAGASTLPFPYENQGLLAVGAAPHSLTFTVDQAGPFTLELTDRGSPSEATTVRAWLFRTDVQPAVLYGFLMTRENLAFTSVLSPVTYSRGSLPAGDYTLIVAPMELAAPANIALSRPFGLRLAAEESFGQAPDGREPNDHPGEASPVTLPFTGTGLGFETPFAMDHYTFDVTDTTTVSIATSTTEGLHLTYLVPAGTVDILDAWANAAVLAEGDGSTVSQTVQATVPPGSYTALIWDWGGRARTYGLEISGAPPAADFPAARVPSAGKPVDGHGARTAPAALPPTVDLRTLGRRR